MKTKILLLCILGLGLIALQPAIFERASASAPGPAPAPRVQDPPARPRPAAARLAYMRSATPQVAGLTFTVNRAGDGPDAQIGDGVCETGNGCTLRAAIQEANSQAGRDTINFAVDAALPISISLASPLPQITSPILIDGTSQLGYAGTPVIELNGGNLAGAGLDISAGSSEVLALAINRFSGAGIILRDTGESIVSGCFIGTDPTGNIALPNGSGINIIDSSGNFIGGAAPGQRNVISGNTGAGIGFLQDQSVFNTVIGNFIGTDAAGTSPLGNGADGISVGGSSNQIGSPFIDEGNVISANLNGVTLTATANENVIQGNFIGTDAGGTADLGNQMFGISVAGSGNIIGESPGDAPRSTDSGVHPQGLPATPRNIIAFNGDDGVAVISGINNSILANSIFSNSLLGIDLGSDGVTPNDAGDPDAGPNNLQNFPVLTSASATSDEVTVDGSINSKPNSTYRLDFYTNTACDASGFGEGQRFLGTRDVVTNADGVATFSETLGGVVAQGSAITATATDILGNTSEFSQCALVGEPVVITDVAVNKTASPNPVPSGSNLTYTITVNNISNATAEGVVVSDQLPAGTTFVSLASPGNCMAPPVGGTGQVTCALGSLAPNSQAVLTLVVKVTAAQQATITNTVGVTTTSNDGNPDNNSSTTMTPVIAALDCTIECPPDQVVNVSAKQCGAAVAYPAPQVTDCGAVTCTPPSGSTFPVGLTTVTCTTFAGPACSFDVTVVDNIPPTIDCPGSIVIKPPQGASSAVVSFPAPTVTDNCPGATVQCQPPAGASFPPGVTTVICVATDAAFNGKSCSFTVTVDNQAPSISCPQNLTVQLAGSGCSTTINYPTPVVADNQPGVAVACSPPSGSIFPAGVTTVSCTASDLSGNTSACSFTITIDPGPSLTLSVSLNITLGPGEPVRKPNQSRPSNCADCTEQFATIENTGCANATLTLVSIMRVGADVNNGKIIDTDDSAFFSVSVIGNNGQATPLPPGSTVTVPPGQSRQVRITFRPVIPAYANRNDRLAASQVLPDVVRARLTFRSSPLSEFPVDVVGRVNTGVKLLHPTNPRKAKTVFFQRSGDELKITYGVFDSNLNVQRARYEFFDSRGRAVGPVFEVDLAETIRGRNLVRGQSFTVMQRFAGALTSPAIASVRVTVFDEESSDTATGQLGASPSASAAFESILRTRGNLIILPDLWLKRPETN